MVPYWVVFCDIIRKIFLSLLPEYVEIIFLYSVFDPIKYHIYCYGTLCCFDVTLVLISVDVLSAVTGVGGCECPIYARDVCMDVAFWQFSNNNPNSASLEDAMKIFIMLHSTCTGPFYRGISCICVLDFGTRKKYPPSLLRAYGSEI